MLLENGIEDEKASAGDRCPRPGLCPWSCSDRSVEHSTNQRTVSLFWCQSVDEASPSETGSLMVEGLNDDLPVRRRMVTGPEISMESLILAQDERWRRA